jgi:hypothetical protein
MSSFVFWLCGAVMMASEWQLEVIRIRASRKELFSTPFFLVKGRDYMGWSAVCLGTMLLSYATVLAASWAEGSWAGALLFLIGFWQLAELQFKTVSLKPYRPPMFLAWATEEIEMDMGLKKLDRVLHVSFWGDVWLLVIFVAFAINFL